MDEKTELEPCPFCGSIPTIEPWHGGRPTKKMVSCQGAEANSVMGRGPVTCAVAPCVTGETKKAAIANWNRRSPSLERVEVLEEALRECGADWKSPPCTLAEAPALLWAEFIRRAQLARATVEDSTND